MKIRSSIVQFVMPWAPTLVAVVLAFTVFLGLTTKAAAAPFFPQITVDSREGPGQHLFTTTEGFHYTAGVGWAGSAKALAITFDGITFTPLVNGTLDARSAFGSASTQNGVVTGNFVPPNLGPSDLVLADVTGVLLRGVYYNRSVYGRIGTNQGVSVGAWEVTGGSLAPLFFAAAGSTASFNFDIFNVNPPFSQNSFDSNFDGQLAGTIAPIPEPSSLMLLSLGAVSVAGFARVKRKRAR
jgi:hypothetical protein